MGANKGTAGIIKNRPISSTESQIEFEVRYVGDYPFFLDQQFITVSLSANTSEVNNKVQIAAMALINQEFGDGTITDKNDVRLNAGLVS